jgi:hypothetical protein
MTNTNTKIWFLLLAAAMLAGCAADTAARRAQQMNAARALVEQNAGASLSEAEKAHMAGVLYQQMEAGYWARRAAIGQSIQQAGQAWDRPAVYPRSSFTTHTGNTSYTTYGY